MKNTFTCLLLGEAGTGKTTYIKKLNGKKFDPRYLATLGVTFSSVKEKGIITFNILDHAGQEKFDGYNTSHFKDADCAIIMCDSQKISHKGMSWYKNILKENNRDIPTVYVQNKSDIEDTLYEDVDFLISCRKSSDTELHAPLSHLYSKMVTA